MFDPGMNPFGSPQGSPDRGEVLALPQYQIAAISRKDDHQLSHQIMSDMRTVNSPLVHAAYNLRSSNLANNLFQTHFLGLNAGQNPMKTDDRQEFQSELKTSQYPCKAN